MVQKLATKEMRSLHDHLIYYKLRSQRISNQLQDERELCPKTERLGRYSLVYVLLGGSSVLPQQWVKSTRDASYVCTCIGRHSVRGDDHNKILSLPIYSIVPDRKQFVVSMVIHGYSGCFDIYTQNDKVHRQVV